MKTTVYVILYTSGSSEPKTYTTQSKDQALKQAIDLTSNRQDKLYSITALHYVHAFRYPQQHAMNLVIRDSNFELDYEATDEPAEECTSIEPVEETPESPSERKRSSTYHGVEF